MKSAKQIREKIQDERERLIHDQGHLASITRGWLEALQWVLERDDE